MYFQSNNVPRLYFLPVRFIFRKKTSIVSQHTAVSNTLLCRLFQII